MYCNKKTWGYEHKIQCSITKALIRLSLSSGGFIQNQVHHKISRNLLLPIYTSNNILKDEIGQILYCTNVVMCLSTQAHNVGNTTQWNVPNNIHLPPHIQEIQSTLTHTRYTIDNTIMQHNKRNTIEFQSYNIE